MHGPPRDLHAFLDRLRAAGELTEVDAEVDADLELAEVHRRVIAAGGPALLFRRVRGSPFPVVTNLFGSRARVDLAFGDRPRELLQQVAALPEELLPPTVGKLWARRGLFAALARSMPKSVRGGPIAEVVESPPRLDRLPALKTWPRDGGRFLTLPLVHTRDPVSDVENLGMYRVQLFDAERCGVHMQIQKGGGFHLARAEELRRPLPVHIHLGGPPAAILGAIAPLPENVPELLLAGLALGSRLELARVTEDGLPLLARGEFCLVGEIEPGARRPEGPFGDHYGYYSETHDYPFMRVRKMYRRRDAIFPATVVDKPRQEDFFLGDYLQELLSPLFPLAMPGVRDLWSYGETGYHSLSAAVVAERYKREAMVSAFRILGEGQLSLTKFLLVTDRPVDLRSFPATLAHVLARADFRTDLFVFANLSMDSLDYTGPTIERGSKGVLLGVGEPLRELPREFTGEPTCGARGAQPFCPGCLVVEGPPHAEDPDAGERFVRDPAFAGWPLLVLTDDLQAHVRSTARFLWATFTRFDPARDIHARRAELVHNHAALHPPILIDARMKADYPAELFCDERTAETVTRRWAEYFPGGMEMGDSDAANLG